MAHFLASFSQRIDQIQSHHHALLSIAPGWSCHQGVFMWR
jgi:hypothetical protein